MLFVLLLVRNGPGFSTAEFMSANCFKATVGMQKHGPEVISIFTRWELAVEAGAYIAKLIKKC